MDYDGRQQQRQQQNVWSLDDSDGGGAVKGVPTSLGYVGGKGILKSFSKILPTPKPD